MKSRSQNRVKENVYYNEITQNWHLLHVNPSPNTHTASRSESTAPLFPHLWGGIRKWLGGQEILIKNHTREHLDNNKVLNDYQKCIKGESWGSEE